MLEFRVTDTGIGISRHNQQSLFQLFSQVDSSTTRKYDGVGLGLAISRRLCQLLGGDIGVRSTPGKGSIFYFQIAARAVDEAAVSLAQQHLGGHGPSPIAAQHPLSIILAEDNPTSARLLHALLKRLGYEATIAREGKELLTQVTTGHFNVALIDLNMPGLDGIQATYKIRAWERNHPTARPVHIVAVTASAFPGTREHCLSVGMDDFMPKPIVIEDLAAMLKRVPPSSNALSA